MSTTSPTFVLCIWISLIGLADFQEVSAYADATPAAGTVLWETTLPKGGWRPFGSGTQDSEATASGLSIIVSWTEATWGVGAVYPDPNAAAVRQLPPLSRVHKIRFEARGTTADQTTVTVELSHGEENAFRAVDTLAKSLSMQWQTLEFDISRGFPNLGPPELATINTIRILFLNSTKAGRNTVEFRNVTLAP